MAQLSNDGCRQIVQNTKRCFVATISVKVACIKVAFVIDRVDGVIIFDHLHLRKSQPFIQSYSTLIIRNHMQIQRPTIPPLSNNHIDHPIHQQASQSASSKFRTGSQCHDVKHFGMSMGVGNEEGRGFVSSELCVEGGYVLFGGHGGWEEGADDAAYDAFSVVVVVWSFHYFVVVVVGMSFLLLFIGTIAATDITIMTCIAIIAIKPKSIAVKLFHLLFFHLMMD
mmetsp:Transcript_40480/g.71210  ORF Transcript_40480/g.71210 Transcript_40480/m.71210 type:complete len:225 (+) Transcript_40480:116-790(+)